MEFFKKLNTVKFFIEVERYFGEYRDDLRGLVFTFIKELDDYTKAALLNELILNYPSGFNPPDVYIFNKYLKKAEEKAFKVKNSCSKLAKNEEIEDEPCIFSNPLQELAKEYGLDENEPNLWRKIVQKSLAKNSKK